MKNEALISKEDVLFTVCQALHSKIGERLNAYNSPLNVVVDSFKEKEKEKIMEICREALKSVVNNKKFAETVKQEFEHKVAKSLVGKLEGSVEKATEVLRQNPSFRAEMILVVEKMVKDNK